MDHLHPRVLLSDGRMIRVQYEIWSPEFSDPAGGKREVPVVTHLEYRTYQDLQEAINKNHIDLYSITHIEEA